VYGFHKKLKRDADGKAIGERELIDDLASIAWQGRPLFIVYDSDAVTNRHVRMAEWHLAETLKRHGAAVKTVRLPPGEPGPDGAPAKVGLDDFLVAHGAEALRRLLDAATEPEPPPAGLAPNEAPDDPDRLGRLFLDQSHKIADVLTLRFHRAQWWEWRDTSYHELPDAELSGALHDCIKAEFDRLNIAAQILAAAKGEPPPYVRKITKGLLTNAEAALASMTILRAEVESPAWWNGKEWTPRNLIALSNGLLDLGEFFAGRSNVLLPHSPRWFSTTCLPYPFDPDADCPRWQAFLARNLEADCERIALLQEWFGYCLTPDTSRQKFIVIEGEGGNGKSVVCAALEATLGRDNCSHVPLEVFGERFQLTATLGKLANIASEVGELDKAAEGYLKSFTAGDTMQFDRKYKPTVSAPPTARLVLATNNRPRFSDRSGGLWRRMILMPFRVVIADDDPGRVFGMHESEWWEESGELPGIFAWALAGLDRLRRQAQFTRSEVCEQALDEYRIENNPARMFLLESCQEDPQGQTPCGELYQSYRNWCESHGYSPLADRSFGKEVRRVFRKAERREVGQRGCRAYAYLGVARQS
jgi:P4 family phage/plasmid primase-like protien